jgi:hypothetical protein
MRSADKRSQVMGSLEALEGGRDHGILLEVPREQRQIALLAYRCCVVRP